jgi:murein DD-endopeptidase MepM/ murein hydrolase activator NlpD
MSFHLPLRGPDRPILLRIAGAALAVLIIVLSLGTPVRRAFRSASGEDGRKAGPEREVVSDTLTRGMALADLMSSHGLSAAQVHEIAGLVRDYRMPRTLRPGAVMRFASLPGSLPDRMDLQLTPDSILHFEDSDSGWSAGIALVPFAVDTLRLSGVIESSLWEAKLGGDVDRLEPGGYEEIVYNMADIFAWKVDFTRDIRKGDSFRVAFERKVRPDGSVRSRQFLAIQLTNAGRVLTAVPVFGPDGRATYYDAEGRSLRGAFLRYPVPYRITSRFTMRRYHPILKRYRPHEGIDYGAPYGTPVHATASGTVTRAGRWGGYGNIVELRHAHGIRTRYAHLSAISRGVRPGAHVEQDQVIGRVGATGLATGPHLHYEFLKNGRHRNPLTVDLPSEPALAANRMPAFLRDRDRALSLFDGPTLPGAPQLAAAEEPATPTQRQ